ncbi:inositol polyphosphate 5-phosphatase OCRL-like isoform X2 [Dreissena polymorpha]|uniref:inositol polyphosphate 5-phosphatase OCRL-like isoform X2 n=1 Tax=Dreissena polymorpha TaxID=45954 RepID=UPI0022654B0B|nr:inositol polyphosphate 5-phosphatase OCRL-like isoform X2 [Dreissena polymorpha]
MNMAASPSEVFKLVKRKLVADAVCLQCVDADALSDHEVKTRKHICLIERQGDNAIFIYVSKVPCLSVDDLRLEQVIPVNDRLKVITEPPKTGTQGILLGLQWEGMKYLFDLKSGTEGSQFVSELKNKIAIQSQNAGFALPSSFTWLDKYRSDSMASTHAHTDDNPFSNDVFDPLKYMNIDDKNSKVTASENVSREKNDEFIFNHEHYTTSNSSDSLQESIEEVAERQLGLQRGVHLADGIKPLTAREKLVEHQLKNRQREFVRTEMFRVFVGTWNVNGQNTTNLDEWLACDKDPPDIYAVGFQELDLSNQAYIFTDSVREKDWADAVSKHLHPKARYAKVASVRLVGVLLLVFIKEVHMEFVKLDDVDSVPTGIMGMLGNKGGVGVRFSLHDTTLLFINSHLAAHQDEYERRNQDACDIEARMRFKQFLPPLTVQDHDVVFWLGDLNYRIDQDINTVKSLVVRGLYNKLTPHDQLYKQLKTHSVFKKFKEGEIKFAPTYRYDTGTDNFDTSEKARNPAWCDRILFKGEEIKQIVYRSHPVLKISDHKPVSSLFDTGIKVVQPDNYKKVYEDIMKQIDRLENDHLPQVSLAQREFTFKDVKFGEKQHQILALANVGQIPVTYEFINKPNENTFCKPWLKVSPESSVIEPGDSCEISLEVHVDETLAYMFNCGFDKIDDILVLHLHGGKDFFIPVSGNYIISSFGSSIEALVQMHGPIREVPTAQLIDLERPGSLDNVDTLKEGTRLYDCPKEIFRLVDHIWQYGRHQEDLFREQGLVTEINHIRDCLDTGSPSMIPGGVHSVCAALCLFLKSLAEPVIPYNMYETCIGCCNSYLLCTQAMEKVPFCHRRVFRYLCAFFRQLLEESKFNNLDVKHLAQLFGNVILRAPPVRMSKARRSMAAVEDMKRAAFLYHFLTHEYDG